MGKKVDLTGQNFGRLTAIQIVVKTKQYSNIWECEGDCGNIMTVQGGNLRNGNTTNCGCNRISSKGEELVVDLLTNNNIKYIREYSFNDLRNKSGNLLRFDFAIFDDDCDLIMLVEYQGKQHYIDCGKFGEYQRKYSDPIKRSYCKNHNIPLYEIKYDEDLKYILPDMLKKIKQYTKTKK